VQKDYLALQGFRAQTSRSGPFPRFVRLMTVSCPPFAYSGCLLD
jgi:hypothetical protein